MIQSLIRTAYKIGMSQIQGEIEPLVSHLIENKVGLYNNVLEIGTRMGGTLSIWQSICSGKIISLDMPGGDYGGWVTNEHPYLGDTLTPRNKFFEKRMMSGQCGKTTMVMGDSHTQSSYHKVLEILDGEELGLLFIDGDHTYEGVKKDYDMYGPLVKPGGFIVFHDITDSDHHRQLNVNVAKLWNEIEGDKTTFETNSVWGYGIGVLRV